MDFGVGVLTWNRSAHDGAVADRHDGLERRADRWMCMGGRRKPGATIDQARANLNVLMEGLDAANPLTNKGRHLTLKATNDVHFHPSVDAVAVPVAVALMVVVGLVLLIACANVASMLLARASGRQKEIGIRLAIGASRGRLVQQLITESVVMSGSARPADCCWRVVTTLVSALNLPLPIPLVFDLRIDGACSVHAGDDAARERAGRPHAGHPGVEAEPRRRSARRLRRSSAGGRRFTLRDVLVAGQIAVTALLLVVAALLTRSLMAAERTSVGFPASRLAVVSTDTGMLSYSPERSRQFYDQAVARVSQIAGVESAALVTRVPLQVNTSRWEIWIPGRHMPGEHGDIIEQTSVSPDYFRTVGVPIVEGRPFTDADRPDTPRVAIVNETMARRLARQARSARRCGRRTAVFEIVGVPDHKVVTVAEPPTPFLQVARNQRPSSCVAILADARATRRRSCATCAASCSRSSRTSSSSRTRRGRGSGCDISRRARASVAGERRRADGDAAGGDRALRRHRLLGGAPHADRDRIALGAGKSAVVGLVMRQGLFVAAAGLLAGCLLTRSWRPSSRAIPACCTAPASRIRPRGCRRSCCCSACPRSRTSSHGAPRVDPTSAQVE